MKTGFITVFKPSYPGKMSWIRPWYSWMFDLKNNCNLTSLWINELTFSVHMKCYAILYKHVTVHKKAKFLWDISKHYIATLFSVEEFVRVLIASRLSQRVQALSCIQNYRMASSTDSRSICWNNSEVTYTSGVNACVRCVWNKLLWNCEFVWWWLQRKNRILEYWLQFL